MPKVKNPH